MPRPSPSPHRLFTVGDFTAHELGEHDLPALQELFAANPDYFVEVHGMLPRADEARRELADRPPPSMPFDEVHALGFVDASGRLVAMASVVSDLMAAGVWHVGLFIVASSLHGSGVAADLYAGLERWMKERGAVWVRLGAVAGRARAERFWGSRGFVEVRRLPGTQLGELVHTVRVLVKPVAARADDWDVEEYLRRVPRDRELAVAHGFLVRP